MKRVCGFALLALTVASQAQERAFELFLADAKVGEGSVRTEPGGKVVSTAKMTVGTTTIDSELTLERNAAGKILSVRVVESAGKNKGEITFKNGKLTIVGNGKPGPVTDRPTPQAVFSPYHPISWDTLGVALRKGGTVEVTELQALTTMKFKFSAATESFEGKPAYRSTASLGGLTLEFLADEKAAKGLRIEAQNFQAAETGWKPLFVDPLAKFPELSQPTFKTKTETLEFKTPDGAKLVADVVRPDAEGKFPVILSRTPYGRQSAAILGNRYARRGYVYVSQDVRGTGDSTGVWDPFNRDREDGRWTLDWIVAQPWAEPKVGMIGASYGGSVQWAAAVTGHPALKCIIPQVSPPEPTRNVPWDNGAFLLAGALWWARIVRSGTADLSTIGQVVDPKPLATMPLTLADDKMFGKNVPFYDNWLMRDEPSKWPGAFTTAQVGATKIPALHISGTWDGDGVGTQLHWTARREAGNDQQWLIFGPWEHAFNTNQSHAGVDYGKQSLLELESVYLRWFDAWLKGKAVGLEKLPKVRFFITGANKWHDGADWPAVRAVPRRFGLFSPSVKGGAGRLESLDPVAGSFRQSGPLSMPKPIAAGNEKWSFTYDPAKIKYEAPIDPGSGSKPVVFKDMAKEWLVFQTSGFRRSRTLAGTMTVKLLVSTSAKDATFFAIPFDRSPEGRYRVIGQPGKMRLGYRNGRREPVKPGQAYEIEVNPWWFAHEFKKGHSLVLAVGCNAFPGFARNPGTGEPDATAKRMVKATQTVFLQGKSRVTLWELP